MGAGEPVTREELVVKIIRTTEEIQTAGYCHKRDLIRHLRKLRKELQKYDRESACIAR